MQGHCRPCRPFFCFYLDILEKSHLVYGTKVLIKPLIVEPITFFSSNYSQNGLFFYALITVNIDRIHLDNPNDLIINIQGNPFNRFF
ncbi:hypothetical protein ES703_86869 [subsurface metagenome]